MIRLIGQQIRETRAAADMTQEDLGRSAGLSGKYVSEIERGTRDLPLGTLHAIVEEGLGRDLLIDFRERNRTKPIPRIAPLPLAVDKIARDLAQLSPARREEILAIVERLIQLSHK